LKTQQHKKYAQTTPLDDGVSSLCLYLNLLLHFLTYGDLLDKRNIKKIKNNTHYFKYRQFMQYNSCMLESLLEEILLSSNNDEI
jgi:hypothetical protein